MTGPEHASLAGDDDQGADHPRGEAAEVTTEADVRVAEAERQIDQEDDANRRGHSVEAAAPGDHEGRAKETEDRPEAPIVRASGLSRSAPKAPPNSEAK